MTERLVPMTSSGRATGQAARFSQVYDEYRKAPEVTRKRMYLETMENVLSKVDKTIIEANGVTPYLPPWGQPASKLPRIELTRPPHAIGSNTMNRLAVPFRSYS